MHTFGARLRAARNAMGWTQQRLGDAIGVSKGAVSRWESDQDQPQMSLLAPISRELRVSLDHLVCGKSKEITQRDQLSKIAEDSALYGTRLSEDELAVIAGLNRMNDAERAAMVGFFKAVK